jgi:hypothetical protein
MSQSFQNVSLRLPIRCRKEITDPFHHLRSDNAMNTRNVPQKTKTRIQQGTLRGPFRMRISDHAEQLDFELLSEEERTVLARGIRFDPSRYEVYRFMVVLESLLEAPESGIFSNWSRRLKRQSLARADRALVRVAPGSKQVAFVGIYPTTRDVHGQSTLDLEGEALLSVDVKVLKLSIGGKVKEQVRRKKFAVLAGRTDRTAEWVFLKPYLDSGEELRLQFCCLVPNSLVDAERYLRCEIVVEDGKRVIESKRKKIRLTRRE